MKLFAIAIVLLLLGGCTAKESDDIVKLRLTQEFAKDERTFHECADWARESLGEDASGAEQMELTNSCLHMQTDLQDREADIKDKEKELETAKRELQEARQKIEDARRKREAERERELEETKRKLEEERRKREAAEKERAQANIPQSAPVIVMTVTPSPKAGGQGKDNLSVDRQWTILNNEAWALLNQGKHEEALPAAKKALVFAEKYKGRNHLDTASSLVQLAHMHSYSGQYSSAVPLLRRALAIQEAELGPNHRDVGDTLSRLAHAYTNQVSASRFTTNKHLLNNEDEFFAALSPAVSWFRRALAIEEAALGKDHPEVATTLHNFAGLYDFAGKYELAEELYCRALEIKQTMYEWDDYELRVTKHNLASLYEGYMGERDKAIALDNAAAYNYSFSDDVRDILKEWGELPCIGEEWETLNAEVKSLIEQDKYETALPVAKEALALAEEQKGTYHRDLATSLNNLALVYSRQGNYPLAVPLYRRALTIRDAREAKYGKAVRPELVSTLHGLAWAYIKQENYSSAVRLCNRALEMQEAKYGKDHSKVAYTLKILALAHFKQGDYSLALPLLRRTLAIREATYGKVHPEVADELHILATTYKSQGDYSSALPLYRRALAIREEKLGKGHPQTEKTRAKLADLYDDMGEADKAVAVRAGKTPPS